MKILGCIVFFFLFTSLAGFYFAIQPRKFISHITPAHFNVPYEDIKLRTADNLTLSGWFIPSKIKTNKAIILLHGYPADKGDILPSRIFLYKNFNLLFLDFRSFGQSEGAITTLGAKEVLDVKAAVDFLKKKGMTHIGIWGLSLGGAVSLLAAAQMPDIQAVVSESAFANLYTMVFDYYRIPLLRYPLGELTRLWGILFLGLDIKTISPAKAANQLRIPILIMHSRHDDVIAFQHGLLLEQAVQENPKAQVIFFDYGRHGQPMENYQTIVREFFQKNL